MSVSSDSTIVTGGYVGGTSSISLIVLRGFGVGVAPPPPHPSAVVTPVTTGLLETKGEAGGYTVPRPFYKPIGDLFNQWTQVHIPVEEEETEEEKEERERRERLAEAKREAKERLMAQIAEEDELIVRLYG